MKTIKRISYSNAEVFKYKNARVSVASLGDLENYAIELKVLTDDVSSRTIHSVIKDKIVVTYMKISKEAALSIIIGLQEQLRKDGVIVKQ